MSKFNPLRRIEIDGIAHQGFLCKIRFLRRNSPGSAITYAISEKVIAVPGDIDSKSDGATIEVLIRIGRQSFKFSSVEGEHYSGVLKMRWDPTLKFLSLPNQTLSRIPPSAMLALVEKSDKSSPARPEIPFTKFEYIDYSKKGSNPKITLQRPSATEPIPHNLILDQDGSTNSYHRWYIDGTCDAPLGEDISKVSLYFPDANTLEWENPQPPQGSGYIHTLAAERTGSEPNWLTSRTAWTLCTDPDSCCERLT
ncbi:MAG: hypothetical protein JNM84_00100 [Planctomycetes bacterium]|nr:hypothetical protein [Planctomycetota bacterium]